MRGFENAHNYDIETLSQMLVSKNIWDIYEALAAVGLRKIRSFLPEVYNLALYDEDIAIRAQALCTIHDIGGKGSKSMLKALRSSANSELVDQLLGK